MAPDPAPDVAAARFGFNRPMDPQTDWRRQDHLDRLDGDFDLIVIGGGIVGAGVALDATHRGKRVAIIDRGDWAGGTSSRSTKLLHGGVRYLPQMRFGLIRGGLREQRVLGVIADYLVQSIDFVIPIYRNHGFADAPKWARHPRVFPVVIRLGLWWYDRLGVHAKDAKRLLTREELQDRFPRLKMEGLRHGVVYRDAQTDDARLTLMVIRTAVDLGAVALNHAEAVDIENSGSDWTVTVRPRFGHATHDLRAPSVVAATGAEHPPGDLADQLPVMLSKGVHLIVEVDDVGVRDTALVLPETSDGRVLFLVPWQNHVVIGTTDTPYDGDLTHPTADPADIRYLCDEMGTYLDVGEVEPISAWAGLRALVDKAGGTTAEASREHQVVEVAPGYVRVAGGKLTGYRTIAQNVVDRLYGRRTRSRQGTATVQIHGAGMTDDLVRRVAASLDSLGAPQHLGSDIVARYGTAADAMLDLAHHDLALATVIADHWLAAEVVYGVRHECVGTISDFVQRRTRIAWFTKDHARSALPEVGRIMAPELGWNKDRLELELEQAEQDLAAEGL